MNLRTRIPRASTTASAANAVKQSAEPARNATQPTAAAQQQHLLQVLQQIESFDTQKLFTNALTADGRLCPGGPQVTYTWRCFI